MLKRYYSYSLPKALEAVFPDHIWDPVQFAQSPRDGGEIASSTDDANKISDNVSSNDVDAQSASTERVPGGHWHDIRNQRALFDQIAANLGLTKKEDWYNIKFGDMKRIGGSLAAHCYFFFLKNSLTLDRFVTEKRTINY
jgi:hypothetical protein